MVINREAEGMTTGEMVIEEEGSDNGSTEKLGRGRGRPAGSLNKSNGGLSQLKAEVTALTAKVEELQDQINTQPPVQSVPTSSDQLEKRLAVVQYWVETFHQFLLTSRITNSVDKVAEEELALIIQKLPDNSPINAEEG
jgi:hypothetical protein